MQTSNSLYYHSHITQSIEHVQQRTSHYIKHRKQFLKKYCSPIQQKIQLLDKEIAFYKHLIQNQNQMIENEPQVTQLKKEISQFQQTQQYFLSHIDQYQRKILQLTIENSVLENQVHKLKRGLSTLTKQKAHQVYQQLNTQKLNYQQSRINSNNKSGLLNNSRLSHNISHTSNSYSSQHQPPTMLLPTIFKVEKYYVSKQTQNIIDKVDEHVQGKCAKGSNTVDVNCKDVKEIEGNENFNKLSSNQKPHSLPVRQQKSLTSKLSTSIASKLQLTKKQQELKQRFKQVTTSFNKFEILFKQCFEKKRTQVQKSVSQLQSKLITDRQKFLEVCEAVSQRDLKKIGFDHFQALTGNQLMTLFISFPWIQKKIFKELNERRKIVVQLQDHKFL